jgi:hypothetical protein
MDQKSAWKKVEIVKVLPSGTAQLKFDASITGHVRIGSKLVSLATARHTHQVVSDADGFFTVPIGRGERADLLIGHVGFFFEWINSYEALPRRLGLEAGEKKRFILLSLLLLFLISGFVLMAEFGPILEKEKAPERIVTLLPREAPSKAAAGLRKSEQGGAQTGAAGKAATKATTKVSAADQVRRANLGSVVSGLTSVGTQAPSAHQSSDAAAVEQVGTGGFTTDGIKTGGGGKTVGLGHTIGQGEGGFEGTGKLGLSGDAAVEHGSGYGATDKIVQGGLSRDVIESIIRRRQYRIRLCYERQLNFNSKLAGKISMHFVIGGKGSVIKANIAEDTMKNESVRNCVVDEVKSWIFPAPEGGTLVNVDYPFVFESSAHTAG